MVRKQRSNLTDNDRKRGILYSSQLKENSGSYMKRHVVTTNKNFIEGDYEILDYCENMEEVRETIERLEDDSFFNSHCKVNIIKN